MFPRECDIRSIFGTFGNFVGFFSLSKEFGEKFQRGKMEYALLKTGK